ncbi:DUF2231 domain-containing protein [Nitrosococcus wardiae]|uniref:DUF2231 domain-containing protein n=1 Tax=Nitrosococcus wardiae TaxID=1814290 RepID=A0A4P7BWR9_9GAMM|nr:DUF2231 domain-containing protein [Nitrosococcus wardiae]QBQ53669.1 DUF2231 domain-containing protein [Nitrosococcus wardiae]
MANTQMPQQEGVKSTAAIGGHPVHPMLIPFPIAFLVGALLTDLTYLGTTDFFWARASLWLIAAGFISGALAAVFGLTDFMTIPRVREHNIAWIHFLGNATVLLLALINWLLRLGEPVASILPWGLLLSALTTVILLVTGWYGGELAYRHKIGVVDHESQ